MGCQLSLPLYSITLAHFNLRTNQIIAISADSSTIHYFARGISTMTSLIGLLGGVSRTNPSTFRSRNHCPWMPSLADASHPRRPFVVQGQYLQLPACVHSANNFPGSALRPSVNNLHQSTFCPPQWCFYLYCIGLISWTRLYLRRCCVYVTLVICHQLRRTLGAGSSVLGLLEACSSL